MSTNAQASTGARPATVDPTLNHWMRKADITRALVTGTPAKALCGIEDVPRSYGGGHTSSATAMICPLCALAYESLLPD